VNSQYVQTESTVWQLANPQAVLDNQAGEAMCEQMAPLAPLWVAQLS